MPIFGFVILARGSHQQVVASLGHMFHRRPRRLHARHADVPASFSRAQTRPAYIGRTTSFQTSGFICENSSRTTPSTHNERASGTISIHAGDYI